LAHNLIAFVLPLRYQAEASPHRLFAGWWMTLDEAHCFLAIFHLLIGVLLVLFSRRSRLQLRQIGNPSAPQGNKISAGFRNPLGAKAVSCTHLFCFFVREKVYFCFVVSLFSPIFA